MPRAPSKGQVIFSVISVLFLVLGRGCFVAALLAIDGNLAAAVAGGTCISDSQVLYMTQSTMTLAWRWSSNGMGSVAFWR